MTAAAHLYRRTCLIAALFFTLCFDPVAAQSGGINWEAVGISWVLSAVTTCLLIAAAFGIRGCLKRKKDVKTSNDDEDDAEHGERQRLGPAAVDQQNLVTPDDKLNNGLLSVSQQSAYLRAQKDTGKNRKKSQPQRVKTENEPNDWVEQWCEEQANRDSVVAALQTVVNDSPAPSVSVRDDRLLRYPAGLDLPSTDIRQSTRNDRNKDPVQKRTGPSTLAHAESREPQPCNSRRETALQRPTGQILAADAYARALEDKHAVRNSNHIHVSTPKRAAVATEVKTVSKVPLNIEVMPSKSASYAPVSKSQPSVLKIGVIDELKNSPVRVQKYQREAQKRSDMPEPVAKTKALEFKRPPNELGPFVTDETAFQTRKDQFHKEVVVDKGEVKKALSQKQVTVTSSEEEEEEEEEETEEESEKEPVDPAPLRASNPPAVSETNEKPPSSQTRGVKRSLSPSADHNESPDIPTSVRPTKSSVVESTPPTPARPTSVRRAPRQSRPSVLNIVPVPADGVSPPPGLLPLTASSHHQVAKSQRHMAATVSKVEEDKRGRKTDKKDEEKAVERRQKSSKKDRSKERPPSFDLKNKRASTGSDILFFAPELQGTSTPAMKPKSAFVPASAPLLSHDTGDDEDDDDERQKGVGSSKGGVATSTFQTQRPQSTTSQSKEFHGILSDSGLHELAHSVYQQWRQLASNLHIPAEHQVKLVTNHSSDAEKCTYAMLRGWRDCFSGSKTELRSLLSSALVAVNHPEMAEKLLQEEMVGSSEKLDNLKLVSVV